MLPLLLLSLLHIAQPDTTFQKVDSFVCRLQETQAEFPGGTQALMRFIQDNIHFPKDMEAMPVRIVIRFEVTKRGRIKHAKILRPQNPELDQIALDMVRKMPRWKPATWAGKPVASTYTLPVLFEPE